MYYHHQHRARVTYACVLYIGVDAVWRMVYVCTYVRTLYGSGTARVRFVCPAHIPAEQLSGMCACT